MGIEENRIPNDELIHLAKKEEPRFLSILLKDKNLLMDCMAFGIKPSYFWFDDNRFLYKVIMNNYNSYRSLLTRSAMDSIMDMQSSYTDEQRSARKMYWDQIYNRESSSEDYELLKSTINARHVQQQTYDILKENLNKVVRATSGQVDVSDAIKTKFMGLEGMNEDSYSLTMNIEDGMKKVMEHIIDRRENPDNQVGIKCGIKAIDDVFYGFMPGSYTVISGMPGGGKTTLMFNMAFNMAKMGYSVIYVSIEKEAVPLYTRLLSLHALVDYNRIKRGGKDERGIPDHILALFQKATNDIVNVIKPNFECLQFAQGTKLSKILSEADRIKTLKKVDVLILDYLGVVGFETHHPTRPDLDLAETSIRLQNYGKINKIATITAAQLKASSTKEIRKKADKANSDNDISQVTVNTEDLAGSQKVVYDAENTISVVMNGDKPPTKIYVYITKARDNESYKTIVLDFDGKLGRISDPDLQPGQIQAVDDLLYNDNSSSEEIQKQLEDSSDLWTDLATPPPDVNKEELVNIPVSPESSFESEINLDVNDVLEIEEPKQVLKEIDDINIEDIDILDVDDDLLG